MKAFSSDFPNVLEPILRCPDPIARLIVEAQVVEAEDVATTKAAWGDADSTTGFTLSDDGALRLTPVDATTLEHTTGGTDRTAIDDRASVVDVAKVTWAGTESNDLTVTAFRAYLDPVADGVAANKEVVWWELQAYDAQTVDLPSGIEAVLLRPLIEPALRVLASGLTAADFTFDLTPYFLKPKLASASPVPVTYFAIRALKVDGSVAANVAWEWDNATASVTSNDNVLTGATLTNTTTPGYRTEAIPGQTPRCRIRSGTYTTATITFGTNYFDLGAAPAGTVEFVGRGSAGSGTSVTLQVETTHGSGSWVSFTDGQKPVTDLPTVTSRQTYRMRATLTTNGTGTFTPTLRALGVRDVTTTNLTDVASVTGGAVTVDPVDLIASIGECEITVQRDGERDYRSAVEDLLADNDLGDITFRVYVGNPSAVKSQWLHVSDWLIDDYDPQPSQVVFTCLSPLALVRVALPPDLDVGGGVIEREPIVFSLTTLKDTYTDLLDDYIELPARYRGAGPEDDATVVSKVIEGREDPEDIGGADGKAELDAVAFLAGGTVVAQQGRVGFAELYGEKTIARVFARTDIAAVSVTPGFRQRVPEYFVRYAWEPTDRRFRKELRSFHAAALTALGIARVDAPRRLDDVPAQWIPAVRVTNLVQSGTTATADCETTHGLAVGDPVLVDGASVSALNGSFSVAGVTDSDTFTYACATGTTTATGSIEVAILAPRVAARQTTSFGPGLLLWSFRSEYPYPELEIGDLIAIETEQFLARDPNAVRSLRGQLWALAVIVGCHDPMGFEFDCWVRNYADILPSLGSVTAITRVPSRPEAFFRRPQNASGVIAVRLTCNEPGATIKYVVQNAGTTVPLFNDSSWVTYAGEFQLNLSSGTDQQLSAYATLNGLYSPIASWSLNEEPLPALFFFDLATYPAATLLARWIPNPFVGAVRIYRSLTNWPTASEAVTSITRSGATATLTATNPHGLVTGDYMMVSGAVEPEYNVNAAVTVTSETVFTYGVSGTPASPATGTPVFQSARGALDNTAFVTELGTDISAGGIDASGNSVAGANRWTDTTVYGGATTAYVVAVPLNRIGQAAAPAARSAAFLLVNLTTVSALLTTSASVYRTRNGTDCTTRAQHTLTWATVNVVDVSGDVMWIYRRVNGSAWEAVTQDTSPVASASYVDTLDWYYSASGTPLLIEYKLGVAPGPAGTLIVDEYHLALAYRAVICP